jgi:ribose transport system substrate-binding protein
MCIMQILAVHAVPAKHAVSAEAEARKLTAEKGVQVKIDWRTPTEEDPQKEAEAIEQLVNIGASGIAVSCSDANKLTPAIDEAVARGGCR